MSQLYTRSGTEQAATSTNELGQPIYSYESGCTRCGGAGRAEKWRHTGLVCYDCGGSGKGPIRSERLYTREQLDKLNAIAAKREAKRQAKIAAELEARRAPFRAWLAENEHVIAQIRANLDDRGGEYKSLRYGLEDAIARCVIPAAWFLPACIERIVRAGAELDQRAESAHVGTIGERIEIEVTCDKVLDFCERGINGYLLRAFYIALMRDCNGNRIVYKGANYPLNEGETGTFKATVKEHGERNGEKQTTLQRFKVIRVPGVVAYRDQWGQGYDNTGKPIEGDVVEPGSSSEPASADTRG